jgi:hypothetical protein
MNRPEFDRQLARLRATIATLPPEQRESLERLALETLERHEAISRAALRGHRAAERLELSFVQLHEACARLAGLASEARDTITRRPAAPPGLN